MTPPSVFEEECPETPPPSAKAGDEGSRPSGAITAHAAATRPARFTIVFNIDPHLPPRRS
ncbi:hypothetical protein HMPREF1979_00049 [Actinomyces johnsonii F0542]|uniref:Uncharacterized protein n=1 Tax=Actinomyces johnsonii F0542 TaxID=1321818 RepID=U1QE07_9ACTO|nr:hypothetical protein HMPREF1979_00049 [Actinomyces johnsonii F0542]